jgi:hypothetical protein
MNAGARIKHHVACRQIHAPLAEIVLDDQLATVIAGRIAEKSVADRSVRTFIVRPGVLTWFSSPNRIYHTLIWQWSEARPPPPDSRPPAVKNPCTDSCPVARCRRQLSVKSRPEWGAAFLQQI